VFEVAGRRVCVGRASMDAFAEGFQEGASDLAGSEDVTDPDRGVHGREDEFEDHSGSHAVECCRCGAEPAQSEEEDAAGDEYGGEPAEHAGEDIAFIEEPV
jgi:hypothetical protein